MMMIMFAWYTDDCEHLYRKLTTLAAEYSVLAQAHPFTIMALTGAGSSQVFVYVRCWGPILLETETPSSSW